MLKTQSLVIKNDKVPWRIIEEEAVLVDVPGGKVVQLNEAGAFIWDKIDGKRTVAEIVGCLCRFFEVDSQRAEKDALEFLKELSKKKLIKLK